MQQPTDVDLIFTHAVEKKMPGWSTSSSEMKSPSVGVKFRAAL